MKGGATTMKKITEMSRLVLASLMIIAATAAMAQSQTVTITLKNGTIKKYTSWDSIRYVGGEWNTTGGIGVKIYTNGSTVSDDYLYSQMDNFVITTPIISVAAPVISPNGGTITGPTTVTITAETGATIYYTTDGTYPTSSATALTATTNVTLTVTQTTTIRAIAMRHNNFSSETSAVFTMQTPADNNVNANWKETSYGIPESGPKNYTNSAATYTQAWRLEYPHINTSNNSMVVVHATSQYGISLSIELDKSQRANRWSCFEMHNGVPNNNVGRYNGNFMVDDCVPQQYQVTHSEYTTGQYTTSCTNLDGSTTTLFARGHVCASEDRQSHSDQNKQTFFTSNIHPQYQQHNGGLWGRMESKVQDWGYSSSFRDTLYVCKGATIANVTLDGNTVSGTIPYSEVKTKFGVTLTGTLTIPRYWYMAILCYKNGSYHAMAFWTEQINSTCRNTTLSSCMISIDELEQRTGIDFFCNLPDDIENTVEATVETSFWNVTN